MSQPLITLRVQTLEVAVLAASVREILGARSWVPVPGARKELPGVVAWGGRAVAMLDLAWLSPGLRPLKPGETRPRAVLVEVRDSLLAIPADWVSEVRIVEDKAVGPRRLHDLALAPSEVDLGESVVPLLDLRLLLDREAEYART